MKTRILFTNVGNTTISCIYGESAVSYMDAELSNRMPVTVGARIYGIMSNESVYLGTIANYDVYGFTFEHGAKEDFEGEFYIDWTDWKISIGNISRKIENDEAGQSGVITFDNASLNMYYLPTVNRVIGGVTVELDNPVKLGIWFALANGKRSKMRIERVSYNLLDKALLAYDSGAFKDLKTDTSEFLAAAEWGAKGSIIFEGMLNYISLEASEITIDDSGDYIATVTFQVIDKLSSLTMIDIGRAQRAQADARARIGGSLAFNQIGWTIERYTIAGLGTVHLLVSWQKHYNGSYYEPGTQLEQAETVVKRGDIFIHPSVLDASAIGGSSEEYKAQEQFIVVDCGLTLLNDKYTTWVKIIDDKKIAYGATRWDLGIPEIYYYDKSYYGIDEIIEVSGTVATSFNGKKILLGIMANFWSDLAIDMDNVLIPLQYYRQTCGYNPFNKNAFEAVKEIVAILNGYLYIDRLGILRLVSRNDIIIGSSIMTLEPKSIIKNSKKFFWDKIVDRVDVTVKGWGNDSNGGAIEGKGFECVNENIIARNGMSVNLFINSSKLSSVSLLIDVANGYLYKSGDSLGTYESEEYQKARLGEYATYMANIIYDFYGKVRESRSIEYVTNNGYDELGEIPLFLELLDIVTVNEKDYFITKIDTAENEERMKLDLVELTGYAMVNGNVVFPRIS